MNFTKRSTLTAVSLGALTVLSGLTAVPVAFAQGGAQAPAGQQASGDSRTMERADPGMKQVLQKLQELGAKPINTLSVEEARKQPTPADAVKAVLKEQGKSPSMEGVRKQDLTYSGPAGNMPARAYIPENAGPGPLPVIVYFHGGGWVIADLDTYEASAMALAKKANAIVVSAEYRHAPEHKFPAAHEDAVAAYSWVLRNAQSFGGDPTRVAVAGESAGGNLAAHVAIASRQGRFQKPAHMLLVYPVSGTEFDTPSYKENANAKPLNRASMQWFFNNTVAKPEDMQDPRLDLVDRADLKDLPDATVITAEIDPLMSEGKELADKLKKAGVNVTYQNYEGVTHEFFGMTPVVADAEKAQDLAARELKQALAAKATGSTGRGQSR